MYVDNSPGKPCVFIGLRRVSFALFNPQLFHWNRLVPSVHIRLQKYFTSGFTSCLTSGLPVWSRRTNLGEWRKWPAFSYSLSWSDREPGTCAKNYWKTVKLMTSLVIVLDCTVGLLSFEQFTTMLKTSSLIFKSSYFWQFPRQTRTIRVPSTVPI